MKTMKKLIYALLGLLLAGVVVLTGVILLAEYSGRRFAPGGEKSADESRLVYDENGEIAELPAGVPDEALTEGTGEQAPENTASGGEGQAAPDSAASADSPEDHVERTYVMDMESNLFHDPECPDTADIADVNRSEMTTTRAKVLNAGYQPCPVCNP